MQSFTPVPDRRGNPEEAHWRNDSRFSILGFTLDDGVWCSYALEGLDWSEDGFTARAECDIDGDGKVTTYWVTASDAEVRAGTVR